MSYPLDLDKAMELPIDVGALKTENGYCGLGSIFAAIFGENEVQTGLYSDFTGEQKLLHMALESLGLGIEYAQDNFDRPILLGQDAQTVKRQFVTTIAEAGIAAGLFETVEKVSA